MKLLLIFPLLILSTTTVIGQREKTPKDLETAVAWLQRDCSEGFKDTIKATPDEKLLKLCYPWDGDFKTVFEWTNFENKHSKIRKHYEDLGIEENKHQQIIILKAFKRSLLGLPINENEIVQPFKMKEDKWRAEDEVRMTTDTLRGVYIPKDLEDCFNQVDSFWDDSTKAEVKQWTEQDFVAKTHFGFGLWMRNNWQLWGGSRLSKYFNDRGIYHPDDMSGIILTSYHRYLNGQEIKLEEQIKFYQDYWKKVNEEQKEK